MIEGRFYTEYAWDARGDSFAGDVPEEAWPVFRERLQKAEAYANEGRGTIHDNVYKALDEIKKEVNNGRKYRYP